MIAGMRQEILYSFGIARSIYIYHIMAALLQIIEGLLLLIKLKTTSSNRTLSWTTRKRIQVLFNLDK